MSYQTILKLNFNAKNIIINKTIFRITMKKSKKVKDSKKSEPIDPSSIISNEDIYTEQDYVPFENKKTEKDKIYLPETLLHFLLSAIIPRTKTSYPEDITTIENFIHQNDFQDFIRLLEYYDLSKYFVLEEPNSEIGMDILSNNYTGFKFSQDYLASLQCNNTDDMETDLETIAALEDCLTIDDINNLESQYKKYKRHYILLKYPKSITEIKKFLSGYIKNFESNKLEFFNKRAYPYETQIRKISELLSNFYKDYKKKPFPIDFNDIQDNEVRWIEALLSLSKQKFINIEHAPLSYTPSLKIKILQNPEEMKNCIIHQPYIIVNKETGKVIYLGDDENFNFNNTDTNQFRLLITLLENIGKPVTIQTAINKARGKDTKDDSIADKLKDYADDLRKHFKVTKIKTMEITFPKAKGYIMLSFKK